MNGVRERGGGDEGGGGGGISCGAPGGKDEVEVMEE